MKVRSHHPKEKVTLTLDPQDLAELRDLAGARSLSAGVSDAVAARLVQLPHETAVDAWMAELEATDGPVSEAAMTYAEEAFAQLEATAADPVRRAG